jgi:hypothetical protein
MGFGMLGNGVMAYPGLDPVEQPINESMNDIVSMLSEIKDTNRTIAFFMQERAADLLRRHLDPMIADQVTFMYRASIGQIRAIPEAVKNKVLDWACELERRST